MKYGRLITVITATVFGVTSAHAQNGFVTGFMNDGVSLGYEALIHLEDGGTVAGGKTFNNFINSFVLYKVDSVGTTEWSINTIVSNSNQELTGFSLIALPDTGFMFIGFRPLFPGTSLVLLHFDKDGMQTGTSIGYEHSDNLIEIKGFLRSDNTMLVTGRHSTNDGKISLLLFDFSGNILQQSLIQPSLGIGQTVNHLTQWGYSLDANDNLFVTGSVYSPGNPPELHPYYIRINSLLQVTQAHVFSDPPMYYQSFSILPSGDGGVYLLGERDSLYSPNYNLALMRIDSAGQPIFYKEYFSNDSVYTTNWTLFAQLDSSGNIHIMHGNATASTTWSPNRRIHFYELDSTGAVLSSDSKYGETPAGMYLSDQTPVCFFKANENGWSTFSIIAKEDFSTLSTCQSLGSFHDHTVLRNNPTSAVLGVSSVPDSVLTTAVFSTSTSSFSYQYADYCLSAGTPTTNEKPNQVSVSPNPTEYDAFLSTSSSSDNDFAVELLSVAGECVYRSNITSHANEQTTIRLPMEQLAAGIYICRVITATRIQNIRIVKTN